MKKEQFTANGRIVNNYFVGNYSIMITRSKDGLWDVKETNKSGKIDKATHIFSLAKLVREIKEHGTFYMMWRLIVGKYVIYIAELEG